jgi:photosystem II stability/assembly factor-like uncharacterized protein
MRPYMLRHSMFLTRTAAAVWLLSVTAQSALGQGWTVRGGGTTYDLYGVHFLGTQIGTVVGDSGTILRTNDGGNTWTRQVSNTTKTLRAVNFITPSNGVAVGDSGTILFTFDGGGQWIPRPDTIFYTMTTVWMLNPSYVVTSGWSNPLTGIDMLTGDSGLHWGLFNTFRVNATSWQGGRGFKVGTALGYKGIYSAVAMTRDGGATWPNSSTGSTSESLYGVMLLDTATAITVGTSGKIYRIRQTSIWERLTSGITSTLNAVHFGSSQVGVAVGDSAIVRTTDGGNTWIAQPSPPLKGVWMCSPTTGFAVGQGGRILRTDDGGVTWKPRSMNTNVALSTIAGRTNMDLVLAGEGGTITGSADGGDTWVIQRHDTTSHIVGLKFANANRGVAVAREGFTIRTTDGGNLWTSYPVFSVLPYMPAFGAWGGDTLLSLASNAYVYRSMDGGSSWTQFSRGGTMYHIAVATLPAGNGFLLGQMSAPVDYGRIVYRTTDYGATWTEVQRRLVGTAFTFVDTTEGFIVGYAGALWKTTSGGVSWLQKVSRTAQNLNSIAFANKLSGIAVGDSGVIIRTEDGGETWVIEASGVQENLLKVDMSDPRSAMVVGTNATFMQTSTGGYARPGSMALNLPADAMQNSDTAVALSWTSSTAATSYHLQVAYDSFFAQLMINDSLVNGLTYQLSALLRQRTYYWRLRGFNPGGGGDFTPARSFTTIPYPPVAPRLLWPDSAATDQARNGLILRWRYVAVADSYQVQIAKDPGFTQRVADAVVRDTTFIAPGLDTSTTYYWHARSENAGGFGGYSSAFRFITVPLKPPPVALLTPNDSAINVHRPVDFAWSSSVRSMTYRLQVSTIPAFGNGIVLDTATGGLTFRFGVLDPARNYYWRVFASNAGGTDSAAAVRMFLTAPGAPAPPALLQPPPGSLQPRIVALTWRKKTDASDYHVRLALDSILIRQVSNVFLTDTVFVPPQLQYDSTYFWTVSARNAGGEGDSAIVSRFRTIPSPPAPPNLSSPPNGDTLQASSLQLVWDVSTGSTAYHAQLSRDPAFGSMVFDDTIRAGTSVPIAGLTSGTRYYWRVRGRNAWEWGNFTITWTFKVALAPEAPTIVYPAPGSADINPSGPVTFRWGSTSNTSRYQIQVALVQSFARVVFDDSTVTTTAKLVSPLAHATRYFWRVRGISANGIKGQWSDSTKDFSTRSDSTFTYSLSFPSSSPPANSYRLVSFPGQSGFAVSEILSGDQKIAWRLLRENGSAAPPFFDDLSSTSSIVPGEGYWLLKLNAFDFVRKVNLPPPDTNGIVTITIRKGWNIIGNPYALSVPWSTVTFATGIDTLQSPQTYTGVAGMPWDVRTTLDPFTGYYFYNTVASLTSLKVRYPFPMFIQPLPKPAPYDWKVVIHLQIEGQEKDRTTLGISPVARQGYDVLDTYLPPMVADEAQISMHRPEWDSVYSHFSSDIRQALGDGQSWDFEVQGNRMTKGLLRLDEVTSVPAESRVVLVDLQNIAPIDVRAAESYPFTLSATTMKFRLIVGTTAYVEKEMARLMPKEFSLSQNFPNPFNPSTTIRYDVPRHSRVELEVLNILGQRVESLVSGEQNPGRYSVIWNAQASGSHGVASGIYFSRLSVDGRQVAVRKMVLLK